MSLLLAQLTPASLLPAIENEPPQRRPLLKSRASFSELSLPALAVVTIGVFAQNSLPPPKRATQPKALVTEPSLPALPPPLGVFVQESTSARGAAAKRRSYQNDALPPLVSASLPESSASQPKRAHQPKALVTEPSLPALPPPSLGVFIQDSTFRASISARKFLASYEALPALVEPAPPIPPRPRKKVHTIVGIPGGGFPTRQIIDVEADDQDPLKSQAYVELFARFSGMVEKVEQKIEAKETELQAAQSNARFWAMLTLGIVGAKMHGLKGVFAGLAIGTLVTTTTTKKTVETKRLQASSKKRLK